MRSTGVSAASPRDALRTNFLVSRRAEPPSVAPSDVGAWIAGLCAAPDVFVTNARGLVPWWFDTTVHVHARTAFLAPDALQACAAALAACAESMHAEAVDPGQPDRADTAFRVVVRAALRRTPEPAPRAVARLGAYEVGPGEPIHCPRCDAPHRVWATPRSTHGRDPADTLQVLCLACARGELIVTTAGSWSLAWTEAPPGTPVAGPDAARVRVRLLPE